MKGRSTVPFTASDKPQCVWDNGGNPAGEGGFVLGHPHLQTVEAAEDEWGGAVLVYVGGLNLLFWERVGGVGHMDMLGVKRRTQRGADSSEHGRKMAADFFIDFFRRGLVTAC